MAFNEIKEMLKDAVTALKDVASSEGVIGKPVTAGDVAVIPVNKLTCGFVTGGYDMKSKSVKLINENNADEPIGAIGGGVTVVPIGFLTAYNGSVHFIKTQGDNVDKWLDIVQEVLKK